jgi:hypothetical protein
MRYRPLVVILTASALTSGLAAIASATKPMPAQAASIGATLTQVRETRVHEIAAPSEDDFVFPNEKPGLFLSFDLLIPEGLTLIDLDQPTRIRAVDSVGSDLTVIEESFMGTKDHVELEQSFGEAPTGFVMTLATPIRSATRFTVEANMVATLFARTSEKTMAAPTEWTTLPSDLTGGVEVRVKVDGDDASANVHVKPGTAKELFEEITLQGGGQKLNSMGSMWSDDSATFFFDGAFAPDMNVAFTIRTGLTTMPVNVSLVDAVLP